MKNLKKFGFFAFLLFIVMCSMISASDEKKMVLYINSYHTGYKWSDDITRGIKEQLNDSNIQFRIEYLDTKRVGDEKHFQNLFEVYRHKYNNTKVDVILVSDDDAFNFMLKNRDILFPGTPVVFCGVNYLNTTRLDNTKGFTGVNEEVDMRSTLDFALKMHSETKHVLFLSDKTITGKKMEAEFRKIIEDYPHLDFIILPDLPMPEILKAVSELPHDSIVIYSLLLKDGTGKFFEYDESIRLVSQASSVPVYGTWDFSLGYGIIGGMLTSGYFQGTSAGKIAERILNGEDPNNIPILLKSPNRWMFDYEQMKRFGIDEKNLPPNSIVIKKQNSFFQEHKQIILSSITVCVFLLFIIILLTANIQKRRHAEAELRKASEELEQRVKERTKELTDANLMLKKEISQRKKIEKSLQERNAELEKFTRLTIDRELKMIELKKEIEQYKKQKA